MSESIMNIDDPDEDENDGDGSVPLMPYVRSPLTYMQHQPFRNYVNSQNDNWIDGVRRHGSAIYVANPSTATNIFPTTYRSTTIDEYDSVAAATTTTTTTAAAAAAAAATMDSPSQRPRKTRRGENNDTAEAMIQSSSSSLLSSSSMQEDVARNHHRSDNGNGSISRSNNETGIIDLMEDSDISRDPLRQANASSSDGANASRTVDLTSSDSDSEEEEEDRKLPARDGTQDTDASDDDQRGDDEWSCPRCTLINKNTSARCEACQYFNSDIHQQLNRNASGAHERQNTPESSSRQQQPISEPSPLELIGSGAILGAAVGMAGNWVQGRNALSGALEGGTTGAMGGALLHEILQSNNNNNDNRRRPEPATRPTQAGASAYARSNVRNSHNASTGRSSMSYLSHHAEGGSSFRNDSSNDSNVAYARSETEYPITASRNANADFNRSYNIVRARYSDEALMRLVRSHYQLQYRDRGVSGLSEGYTPAGNSSVRHFGNDIDSMNYEQLLNRFGDGTENMGADEGDIRRLPTHIVGDNPLPADARQCLICLEDFEKGDSRTILPCLHGFHKNCCHKWLTTNGKCPICKHPISSNG